jgi:hypothetical protein
VCRAPPHSLPARCSADSTLRRGARDSDRRRIDLAVSVTRRIAIIIFVVISILVVVVVVIVIVIVIVIVSIKPATRRFHSLAAVRIVLFILLLVILCAVAHCCRFRCDRRCYRRGCAFNCCLDRRSAESVCDSLALRRRRSR